MIVYPSASGTIVIVIGHCLSITRTRNSLESTLGRRVPLVPKDSSTPAQGVTNLDVLDSQIMPFRTGIASVSEPD